MTNCGETTGHLTYISMFGMRRKMLGLTHLTDQFAKVLKQSISNSFLPYQRFSGEP